MQALKVETVIHSDWQIELLRRARVTDVRCHVKVNSGMNRLGFAPANVPRVRAKLPRGAPRDGGEPARPHGRARDRVIGGLHGQLRGHPLS